MNPSALARLLALQTDGGFEVPRGPALAVVAAAGLAMVYTGARQVRDPEWSAGRSARYRAEREGLDVDHPEPTAAAVERARKGGYPARAGPLFLLLAPTQVVRYGRS